MPFLKIHLADPALMYRAVTILRSGGVMQRRFEIYESHLNYILQFMCDFGLYGCGELEIAQAAVRERSTAEAEYDTEHGLYVCQSRAVYIADPRTQ